MKASSLNRDVRRSASFGDTASSFLCVHCHQARQFKAQSLRISSRWRPCFGSPRFTMGLCQIAENADHLALTDGRAYSLPSHIPHGLPTKFEMVKILHHCLDLCGGRTFVVLARKTASKYVIFNYTSPELVCSRGRLIINLKNDPQGFMAPQRSFSSSRTRLDEPRNSAVMIHRWHSSRPLLANCL